jgi:hypothetical protein
LLDCLTKRYNEMKSADFQIKPVIPRALRVCKST